MAKAWSIKVRGVVQGVGFRPFVYRLAHANGLSGWVLNAGEGVEIHVEGARDHVRMFLDEMEARPPQAADIAYVRIDPAECGNYASFVIRESSNSKKPSVRISADLPVCEACLKELFDERDPRYLYPYINCTNCGPRYSLIRDLPYDRPATTMAAWPLDQRCADEYSDPANRRFHAQPLACPGCGPHFFFQSADGVVRGDEAAIGKTVAYLVSGKIVAVKGLGGYHLACDATNAGAVSRLRARKFRKERPFALMVKSLEVARTLADLSDEAESLLNSAARPIVLARSKVSLPEVSPENHELGVMLPYTPLHHLLFAGGAPDTLVMTSANRSSEPIAYEDEAALQKLAEIADGFLIGERPVARRVDDSVVRAGTFGTTIVRRSRGYAPGAVAEMPSQRPILALGSDLKNAVTLVVDGQCFVSQHIGDLAHYEARCAFYETIQDLLSMYKIDSDELLVVHDGHPEYVSTLHAPELHAAETRAVQHHIAHIASVLAERASWDERVIGVSFDGTGYGDDGTIWGGEIFAGSVVDGFERIAHLRPASLAGGDAAATFPVQSAAGFLSQVTDQVDFTAAPFSFPSRYESASKLARSGLRCFKTTSMGRLFDAVAALLGFVREMTFEGQAAIWLEQLATGRSNTDYYLFPFVSGELDFRPLLNQIIRDRLRGRDAGEIARAFHRGIAIGMSDAVLSLCQTHRTSTLVLSGGVFQNELLLQDIQSRLQNERLKIWTNHTVPANDGGISLGQAAIAALDKSRSTFAQAAVGSRET